MYERRAETLATAPPLPNDHIGTGHRLSGAAIESIVVGGDCDWAAKTFFGERRREAQSMFAGMAARTDFRSSVGGTRAADVFRRVAASIRGHRYRAIDGFHSQHPAGSQRPDLCGARGGPARTASAGRDRRPLRPRALGAANRGARRTLSRAARPNTVARSAASPARGHRPVGRVFASAGASRAHGAGRSQAIAAICGGPRAAPRQSQRSDDSARGPRRRPHADRQRHSADVPTGADVGVTWSSTVYNLAYMLRLWIVALYDALAGGTTAPRSFAHAIARNVTQEPPTCRIVAAATQEERTPIPAISQ